MLSHVNLAIVMVAEERANPRLPPQSVSLQVPHHGGEPGAAAPARPEDPHYVLRVDTVDLGAAPDQLPSQLGQLPVSLFELPVSLFESVVFALELPVSLFESLSFALQLPVSLVELPFQLDPQRSRWRGTGAHDARLQVQERPYAPAHN